MVIRNHPDREKHADTQAGRQAGRQRTVVQFNIAHTRRKTMDHHRTADTRRLNRETHEGNEGDTGGATETMIS